MALRSMTGYGQAQRSARSGTYRVEIRGVNNRYLDIQIRSPKACAQIEQKVKQMLSDKISRGSLSVNISWEREEEDSRMAWDKKKVAAYIKIFNEINKAHKLKSGVALSDLLAFSDFIRMESVEFDEKALMKIFSPVLSAAIDSFNKSREEEARFIARDMRAMVKKMSDLLEQIVQRAPVRLELYRAAVARRLEGLVPTGVDPQRLAAEVALQADRLDISEECTRLAAHIEKYLSDFSADEPAGKRMTFILQEMNREANTISSKANDTPIAHMSVELKEIIEKLREQAQNIE